MRLRKVGLFLVAVAVAAGSCAAQTSRKTAEDVMHPQMTPPQNPAAVARGKALFASNCSFCHGVEATGGNTGPDLISSVLVNHDENGNLIGPTIHNGRPAKGMPAFANFSSAQISDLVAFLHQQNLDLRLRSGYKILNVAVGNAPAGKVYFNAHCASCHSATGDLAGIARKYEPDKLQMLWLSPGSGGRDVDDELGPKKAVTVTLASGQKFSGRLQHIDEFNVALDDANGYHSFPITAGTTVAVKNPLAAHEQLLKHLTDPDMHNVTTYLETLQ